jgi:hypothetical protein
MVKSIPTAAMRRKRMSQALAQNLEPRMLMSGDWTGVNETQLTAYDFGNVQGTVTPAQASIDSPSDTDWYKFSPQQGTMTVDLTDPQSHAKAILFTPAGEQIPINPGDNVLVTAPTGGVYYVEVMSSAGLLSPNYSLVISAQGSGTSSPGPGDPVPPQTQRADFVAMVYRDTLHRDPDLAGLDAWVGAIQNGTASSGAVAASIVNSTEFRTNVIQGLYQSILGRSADQAGLDAWLAYFAGGGKVEGLKANFYGSQEYFDQHGDNLSQLVDSFYLAFLGRHAEPDGLAAWVGQLQAGRPRSDVALAIEGGSQEGAAVIVTHQYETYLRREPDPAFQSWVNQIEGGESSLDLEISLIGSQEYFNNAAIFIHL